MFNPFRCAGCDEDFEEGQLYWELYDEQGNLFYLDEFCAEAYFADRRREYSGENYMEEEM